MKKNFKYPLAVDGNNDLKLPQGAEILCVQAQHNKPFLWAIVNPHPAHPKEDVHIKTIATGQDIDNQHLKYIGTYQLFNGDLVFHAFKEI